MWLAPDVPLTPFTGEYSTALERCKWEALQEMNRQRRINGGNFGSKAKEEVEERVQFWERVQAIRLVSGGSTWRDSRPMQQVPWGQYRFAFNEELWDDVMFDWRWWEGQDRDISLCLEARCHV